jgi:hypothetical protein
VSRALSLACFAIAILMTGASNLHAQTSLPGRLEIGVGAAWFGETTLGSSDASEATATAATSRLFSTSSTLTSKTGLGVHIGVRLTRRFEAEVSSTFAKPVLATQISNDVENSAAVTATETVRQYTVGGGGLWYLSSGRGARLRPYVSASLSYLRQLHESNTLAVTGRMFEVGGGVKYALRSRPKGLKSVGVRGDARIAASTKGVGFDDSTRYGPSLGASLFVRF